MRTVFITGASSGLGKLTAIHFANNGWNVVATMRMPEARRELAERANLRIIKLDVTDVA